MPKDAWPNHTATQLIWSAERKLRIVEQQIDENAESRRMAGKQLARVRYACHLLEEARLALSAAEEPPEAEQEELPF